MIRTMLIAVLAATLVAVAAVTASRPAGAAELPGLGMCNGRADAMLKVIAHANGHGDGVKLILNVTTDAAAVATGSLILDQGPNHIVVTDFCRVWQHLPGTEQKCEEPYPEGAVTAHAVGVTTDRAGTPLLVRADVRQTAEGKFFRARYRALTGEQEAVAAAMAEEDGCEDEGTWTKVPAEGWAPLDQLIVRAAH